MGIWDSPEMIAAQQKQREQDQALLQQKAAAGDVGAQQSLAQALSEQQRAGQGDWRQNLDQSKVINFGGFTPTSFTPTAYNINPAGTTSNVNYLGQQAPQLNTAQSDQARAQQMALAQQLQGQANGTAPSIAQQQLQAGTDANIAQQMAMAQSGRGNPALAQRLAMDNAANAQQGMVGQAAQARIQEQQGAQQNLGNLLAGTRTQDLTGANANLGAQTQILNTGMGLTQQQNATNQQANLGLQQLGVTNQNALNTLGLANQQGLNQIGLQNQQGLNQNNLGAYNAVQGAQTAANQNSGSMMAGLGGIAGGLMGIFSDEDVKENITEPNKKMGEFLSNIKAHEYEYKDKSMGKGKMVSPMAQELEKSDLGTGMVTDTPMGKMVDYQRGLGAILASQGYLHDKIEGLEKAMKKRGK